MIDEPMAAITVALISTLGVILVAFIQAFKKEARVALKENHDDHEIVQAQLGMIYKTVNRVDDKLEKHIDHHAEGLSNGQVVKRDQKH